MRRVAVGADQRVGEGDAVLHLDHRRHALEVDLVHDAVAGRDDLHVLEGVARPFDEVEAVFVAAVLDGAVPGEGVLLEAGMLDREGMVDDQLHWNDRVDLGRVAALLRDRVAQAGEVDQRGLAEDVMADHACRIPGEVEVALAFDQLRQRAVQQRGVAAADQVLGQHAGDVGQGVVSAGRDGVDRFARVEMVQVGAGQGLAVSCVHGSLRAGACPAI
jgi:hypothetical protein